MVKFKIIGMTIASLMMVMQLLLFLENTKGLGFPSKEKISYTTGTLSYRLVGDELSHPILKNPNTQPMEFSCAYTAIESRERGICLDEPVLKKFSGQLATIGWFKQPKFLWYENSYPQVVSIQVGENNLQTYEMIADTVKSEFKFKMVCLVFLTALSIFLLIKLNKSTLMTLRKT